MGPPNAILFVFDPKNKNVVVPLYIDKQLTAATDSCVSVGTQADVDGDTEIHLTSGNVQPSKLIHVFRGRISTPGGSIAIVTSEFQKILELEIRKQHADVDIWADDLRSPSKVIVDIGTQ